MATDTKMTNVGPDEVTSRDFQRLLQIAEALEKDAEKHEATQQWYFFSLLLVAGGVFALGSVEVSIQIAPLLILTLALIGGLSFVYLLTRYIRFSRLLAKDRIAVYEIIAPLRELERTIAERNHLSALERLELRVRLARFDVDTKYRSQYWPLFKE